MSKIMLMDPSPTDRAMVGQNGPYPFTSWVTRISWEDISPDEILAANPQLAGRLKLS